MRQTSALAALVAGLCAAAGWLLWPAPAPALASEAVAPRLQSVLESIYTAFAAEEEDAIYDALAAVAAEDLVADLYLERRAAQIADHSEDGQALILSVELARVVAEAAGRAWRIDAAWRVVGRLGHGSHEHERLALYEADLTLGEVDGSWKLTAFALRDATRAEDIEFAPGG